MQKNFLVSVIIPVHNSFRFIVRCLRSLKNQTLNKKYYEIIIIDDFSTAFYELLYHKKPFIVLNSAPNVNFTKKFWKPINDLKKINLWFENEKQLAKYLDKNFENIILNWDKTINSKYYTKLRKTLFARENFNDSLFVKKILEL